MSKVKPISDLTREVYSRLKEPLEAHSTGFEKIDTLINGLLPKALIIIGARPRTGKSTIAGQIMHNVSKNLPTLYVSLEMSEEQIITRWAKLYGYTGKSNRLLMHDIEDDSSFRECLKQIGKHKAFVVERGRTVSEVRAMVEETGAKVVIVDTLQKMAGKGDGLRENMRDVTDGLKGIAKDFGITVIGVSQANRAAASSAISEMETLKESGSIEEEGDYVLMLSRIETKTEFEAADGKYPRKLISKEQHMDFKAGEYFVVCHVAKARDGQEGIVNLRFTSYKHYFEEITPSVF